jgi:hypothetical protein
MGDQSSSGEPAGLDATGPIDLGLISDYTYALLAVLVVGWFLSWWVPEQYRWYLLSAAAVVSVFCIGTGVVRLSAHAHRPLE